MSDILAAIFDQQREAQHAGREFCGACGQGCAVCRVRRDSPPPQPLSVWERLDGEGLGDAQRIDELTN